MRGQFHGFGQIVVHRAKDSHDGRVEGIVHHRVSKLVIDGEEVLVTSVFDLQVAQYGIDRGLGDNLATSYDDETVPYTPAWGAKITGIKAADLERTGREFAENASKTRGKSMVIMGAAINHWYHNDLGYRSIMNLLHFCG